MNDTSDIRVVIVGAGPSGLLAARLLQKSGFSCCVFDGAKSFEARQQQGGSLDLKKDSGQVAMEAAGLLQQFLDMAKPGGENLKVYDKAGTICHSEIHEGQDDSYHPEIDRGDLMKILFGSLAKDTVRWGYKLERIEDISYKKCYTLHFSNHQSFSANLIIGADGAWSKVRSFFTDTKPAYSGITFLDLTLNDPLDHPKVTELVGTGSMLALSPSRGIVAQRGAKNIKVYVSLRVPLSFKDDNLPAKGEEQKYISTFIHSYFKDWSEELTNLIMACDPSSMILRPLYQLLVNFKWGHKRNITLVGDAAHLMSPFAGEGVNLAFLDAMDVADSIIGGEGLADFELKMQERASAAAQESANNLELFFNETAPTDVVALFQSLGAPPG